MANRDALKIFATNAMPESQATQIGNNLYNVKNYFIINTSFFVCIAIIVFAVGLRLEYTANTFKR
jgi:hypothetical protein